MKVSLLVRTAGIGAVAVLGLAACGGGSSSGNNSNGSGGGASLSGSGSTFQQTIEEQWTSQFSGSHVSYDAVGSGTGQQQFENGSVDFAGSDVALTDQGAANKRCGGQAVTFPVTAGGVAVIYNLSGISSLKLDAPTLAGIFDGKITKWNDPAIAQQNPGVHLPSTTIEPVHRSDSSGTTSVFTSYLAATAGKSWTLGAGETVNWPGGSQAADGSSGVVQAVKQTSGGITYAEESYAKAPLAAAQIKNSQGTYTPISPANVTPSIASGLDFTGSSQDGLVGTLKFPAMTGYPISTVSYFIACQKYSNGKGAALKKFFNYVVTSGQQSASALDYAPLPSSIVSKDQTLINSIS